MAQSGRISSHSEPPLHLFGRVRGFSMVYDRISIILAFRESEFCANSELSGGLNGDPGIRTDTSAVRKRSFSDWYTHIRFHFQNICGLRAASVRQSGSDLHKSGELFCQALKTDLMHGISDDTNFTL